MSLLNSLWGLPRRLSRRASACPPPFALLATGVFVACALAQPIHAQTAPTVTSLTATSGQVPANLTCTVSGPLKSGTPAPGGTVTFTDLTQSQTLGAVPLAGPAAYSLQSFGP